jgi:hypothetical protein
MGRSERPNSRADKLARYGICPGGRGGGGAALRHSTNQPTATANPKTRSPATIFHQSGGVSPRGVKSGTVG